MKFLSEILNKYNIPHTNLMLEQFDTFYNMVIETNKQFNLTAITEEREFAIKHILDSVLPYSFLPQNALVVDVGAGAGFPSIPLKIVRPDLKITMIDSLNKRVNFLNEVVSNLNLKDIVAIHTRAEDFAIKNRERFDVAVARAVAPLCTLAEYCLPFVKVGGIFVALKGSNLAEELQEAEYAINILGGECQTTQDVFVEEINSTRQNLIIKKVNQSPAKYPRGKNLPRLKPLVKN